MRRRDPIACVLLLVAILAPGAGSAMARSARSARRSEPSTGGLMGNHALGAMADHDRAGWARAFPVADHETGTATGVRVYLDSRNRARTLVAGLYSDRRGGPGARLAVGSLRSPRAGAWNAVALPPTPVTAATTYWVALLGRGGTLYFRDRESSRCRTEKASRAKLTALPSLWPSGRRRATCALSAVVDGTIAPPAITTRSGPTAPSNTAAPILSGSATTTSPVAGSGGGGGGGSGGGASGGGGTGGGGSAGGGGGGGAGAQQSCTRMFTPSSLGSSPYPGAAVETAFTESAGGAVFCFAAGSYGEIDLYNGHPSSPVTFEPVSGATVAMGWFNLNGVSNVTIAGFSGSSSSQGLLVQVAGQGNNSNITFSHNAMTSNGVVIRNGSTDANINITENAFSGFTSSGEQSRLLVNTTGCPNGVTISHNLMNGGEADGIDVDGGSCDTQILSNVISNISEANCGGIHCDGFQDNGGGSGTVISGNWFLNDSDCWLMDDGTSNYTITDNVCETGSDSSYWMQFGGARNLTFAHNTVWSTSGGTFGGDHSQTQSTGVVFQNNVERTPMTLDNVNGTGSSWAESSNVCVQNGSTCQGGSGDVNGTPSFQGGGTPSTWSGFQLAVGSVGVGTASDGGNRGADESSTTPGL